jgi:glutamate racemase
LIPTELQAVLPPGVTLVDSGAAIAQRVQTLLGSVADATLPLRKILFTRLDTSIDQLRPYLKSLGLDETQALIVAKESASSK